MPASPPGDKIEVALEPPGPHWADRGWYLAIEYGVLARDRFLKRLPELRRLGAFRELLEPGGKILYRNIFRLEEVAQAWELFTLLRPWHEQLVCYLMGEQLPIKRTQDLMWCAAFLRQEKPCRGGGTQKNRPVGCEGARILVGPLDWDRESETERHLLTFSRVDEEGRLVFERESLAEFVATGEKNRLCPASPARDPRLFAAAFKEVSVRSLNWPLVAELPTQLKRSLTNKVLAAEHGFVLKKGQADLDAHAPLELRMRNGKLEVRLTDPDSLRGPSLAEILRVPRSLQRVLEGGIRLRGVRIREDYVRLKGGHYEVEQRFVLSSRIRLSSTDRPELFKGYEFSTVPKSTSEYSAWVDRVIATLPD